jgi:PAS domain-containing protein
VLVSVQDLTARVRAEEAARRSERVYRAIIENSFDGVSLLGADLELREVTRSRPGSGSAAELAARDRRDLIHPATAACSPTPSPRLRAPRRTRDGDVPHPRRRGAGTGSRGR